VLFELRSIALGFFQPAFLALPTWRIHASLLRPLACLAHSSLREANITNTHTGAHKRWWVEVKIQERLGEWVLSRNCGCEWGSRQVSTISDAGTRYALRLSQIQEYYSVDLSASVSLCGSLGVFIRYVEGFFASDFLIFILW
jgi:hypothetical protein